MKEKGGVLRFWKKEPVLCIAAVCALASIALNPPSAAYLNYIDWRVLSLLFCLMSVVAGLQECGVFAVLAQRLLAGERRMRFVTLVLVLLPFFVSMLVTNDVALITFVPFAVLVLGLIGRTERLIYIVVLQTIAANLGSMATPVGNPQNLYLYANYELTAGQFFSVMLPLSLVSLVGLVIAALCVKPEGIRVVFADRAAIQSRGKLGLMAVLFVLCLLSVFRVLPYPALLAVVLSAMIIFDRPLFRKVDYGLLATFFCFFLFAGNEGACGPVHDAIAARRPHRRPGQPGHQQRACGGAPVRLYRRLARPADRYQHRRPGYPHCLPGQPHLPEKLPEVPRCPARPVSAGLYRRQCGGSGGALPGGRSAPRLREEEIVLAQGNDV